MATLQTARRVLILDDEQIIANTLVMILNRNGFEAQAVYTAQDAISTAAQLSPDVLISDVIMEGMTGIDAAIRISQLVPDAGSFSFQARRLQRTCSSRLRPAGITLRYSPSLSTRACCCSVLRNRNRAVDHLGRTNAVNV